MVQNLMGKSDQSTFGTQKVSAGAQTEREAERKHGEEERAPRQSVM